MVSRRLDRLDEHHDELDPYDDYSFDESDRCHKHDHSDEVFLMSVAWIDLGF
jgi:hypothetical protein